MNMMMGKTTILTRPPPSSHRPESKEPGLAAVRCRTRLHALPEGPLPASCFTLPSSSSCRHEFNEPGFVAGNLRTRLHAAPKDGCAISLAPSPEFSGTVGSEGLINGSDPSTAQSVCLLPTQSDFTTWHPHQPTRFDPPDPA
ncbi:hypothetical protein PIB30_101159 [Stylosanthes scabra]|uniref:Uncharacterized protein n=1 Tax=Stylosanthes scabra TaxID=79078 RepID=A0ABU6XXI2_9FABA|nr:hypothetical protein [Stylosanthes scabra]